MKSFELSTRKTRDGKRKFKAVLCQVYPDSCVDEVNEVGLKYNKNGITFLESYCEKLLPTIENMSLRCSFIDNERKIMSNHGNTGVSDECEPIYEDAVMIGAFTKGYIDDIETEDGIIRAVIGEGFIDSSCYHNLTVELQENAKLGLYPSGSVEIMHPDDCENIVYKYGWKEKGRIPMRFRFSGYALLQNCEPADNNAKLLELNNKEENTMNEAEIKAVIEKTVAEINSVNSQLETAKSDYEAKLAEINSEKEKIIAEKNELVAEVEKIKQALENVEKERKELDKRYGELYTEREALAKALGEAKARERLAELTAATENFSEDEKAYAKVEIEAFKADPTNCEINSVVSKIYEGIGKSAKSKQEVVSEQNSVNNSVEDIFGEMITAKKIEDINIF